MNILSGDFNDHFGSIPACDDYRWIFNLATCYAGLNGRIRPKADLHRDHFTR
jgi:hypothetical protein